MGNKIDLVKLTSDGKHYAETRNGAVHIIDSETGLTVLVQRRADSVPQDFSEVLLPSGERVLVEKGLEGSALSAKNVPLIPYLIDIMAQKIMEGGKLTEICKEPGMPSYALFSKWRREHPWVVDAIEQARRDRAETMRDLAVQEAEIAESSKDPINAHNLRVETYKWAAGIDDAKFSPRAKIEATVNAPTMIIVQTGIDRTAPDQPGIKASDEVVEVKKSQKPK